MFFFLPCGENAECPRTTQSTSRVAEQDSKIYWGGIRGPRAVCPFETLSLTRNETNCSTLGHALYSIARDEKAVVRVESIYLDHCHGMNGR